MLSVEVQNEVELCSLPCVVSFPNPSLIRVFESPVICKDLEFDAMQLESNSSKAVDSASMLVLSSCLLCPLLLTCVQPR